MMSSGPDLGIQKKLDDKTTTGTMFDKRTARMMVQAELQKL